MGGTAKVPLILATAFAYLYLGPLNASASAILASITYVIASKFKPNLDLLTLAFLGVSLACYYFTGNPVLPYGLFLASLAIDYRRASALLPLAILSSLGGVMVSPITGGYPVRVKLDNEEVQSVFFPLAFASQSVSEVGILGYSVPYVLASSLEYLSHVLPNGFMIKLSLPLLVSIGVGILLNVARISVRGNIVKGKRLKREKR